MADDVDSKSIGSNTVWVRPPPSALKSSLKSKDFWLLFFLTHFFSYFCVLGENADDGIGRGHFAGEIQMCINVACCADVAVTEPLLNLFQAHTIGVEQAGAAMPLRYNNDKRKKPLFSRGLSVCRHLFNSFSKLKCDEKIIEKRRLFH